MKTWISIEDHLPSEYGEYITCHVKYDNMFFLRDWMSDGYFIGDREGKKVTHWMELPPMDDPRWISTDVRKPDVSGIYVSRYTNGYFRGSSYLESIDGFCFEQLYGPVTHWLSLSLPSEVTDA